MVYMTASEQVYYHILEGSPLLFADERCKKKLLDLTFDRYRQLGWRLYAFCVTDSAAYFLSVTGRHGFKGEYLQYVADEFLTWCGESPDIWIGNSISLRARVIREIKSMEEIVECCRLIHRVPLELGYVERLSDYWWSSYITYMETYSWELVDCHAVFVYFSLNSGVARYRIRKFHAFCELPTIYITEANGGCDEKIRK